MQVCDQNKHLPVEYAAVDFTEETMLSGQYEHRLGNRKQYRYQLNVSRLGFFQNNILVCFIPGIWKKLAEMRLFYKKLK